MLQRAECSLSFELSVKARTGSFKCLASAARRGFRYFCSCAAHLNSHKGVVAQLSTLESHIQIFNQGAKNGSDFNSVELDLSSGSCSQGGHAHNAEKPLRLIVVYATRNRYTAYTCTYSIRFTAYPSPVTKCHIKRWLLTDCKKADGSDGSDCVPNRCPNDIWALFGL